MTIISRSQAEKMLDGATPDLAETIIAQADEIEKLKKGSHELGYNVVALDHLCDKGIVDSRVITAIGQAQEEGWSDEKLIMAIDNPDTIGTVEHDGRTYEIDWPHDVDDESRRDPYTAVVYLDGEQIADLPLPGFGQAYSGPEQIMSIAREHIPTIAKEHTND